MSDQSTKSQNPNGSICQMELMDCLHQDLFQVSSLKDQAHTKLNCSNCGSYIFPDGSGVLKDNSMFFEADVAPIEVYEHLLADECLFANYTTFPVAFCSSPFLSAMRKQLIEKIFEFGEKVKQRQLTIHVACGYLDTLLHRSWKSQKDKGDQTPQNLKQQKSRFELKSVMALLVASKYDELDDRIPLIKELQRLLKYQFSYQECKDEENSIVMNLNWNLHIVTPLHFVQNLLSMGVAFTDDKVKKNDTEEEELTDHILKKLRKFSEYFADLAVKSQQMMNIQPSIVAISCILCARMVNKISPIWNPKFAEMTGFSYDQEGIESCFETLYCLYDEKYRSVKKSSAKVEKSRISFSTQKSPDPITFNLSDTKAKKSILEQNQNIMNDSNIDYEKAIQEQEPTPKEQQVTVDIFQTQDLTGSHNTAQRQSSSRCSLSQMCLQKVKPLHHVQEGNQTDKHQSNSLSTSLVKRQSTAAVALNKENQTGQSSSKQKYLEGTMKLNENQYHTKNIMPKSCRISNNVSMSENHPKTITFNLVTAKNESKQSANNSKIGTRATSNSSQPVSQTNQFKQRNPSACNLNVNIVNNAKKQVLKGEIKNKTLNQQQIQQQKGSTNSRIQTLRSNNNSKTRKPSEKPTQSNQRPSVERNTSSLPSNKITQVDVNGKKVFPAQSSRNSSSIANQNKIEEIKNKYQSENTIYEKNALQNGQRQGKYIVKNIKKRGFLPSERSQSECSMEGTLQNQFQTMPGEDGGKTTVVEEEEEEVEVEKEESNSSDVTQQACDEYQANDESVVIKKPMSSKKSKSLENINKIVLKNKMNEKAILELYKNQIGRENIHQRNGTEISSNTGCSKSGTIDFANLKNATNRMNSHNPSVVPAKADAKEKNFIQKNINYVSHLNQNLIHNKLESSKQEEDFLPSKQASSRRKKQSGSMLNQHAPQSHFQCQSQCQTHVPQNQTLQQRGKYSRISSNRLNTNKSLTSLGGMDARETEGAERAKRQINSSMDHDTEISMIEMKGRNKSQFKNGSSSHRQYKESLGKKAVQVHNITNYKYSQGKRFGNQRSPQVVQCALNDEEREPFHTSQNHNISQGSINYKINIYGSNPCDDHSSTKNHSTQFHQYSLQNTARCGSIKNNQSEFQSLFHKIQSRRQSGKQSQNDNQDSHSTVLQNRGNKMVANSTKFQKFQSKKPVKKANHTNSLLEQVLIKKTQLQLQLSQANKTEVESNQSKLDTFEQLPSALPSNKSGNTQKINFAKNQSQTQLSLNTSDSISNQWLQKFKTKQGPGVVKSARGQGPQTDQFTPRDLVKNDGEGFARILSNFLGK